MWDKIVDIHCHILPDIDDGPKELTEAIDMVRSAEEQGVGVIIATPHYIPGDIEYETAEVFRRVGLLRESIAKANINCEIYTGMEVYLSSEVIHHIDQGKVLPLGPHGNYMLVEFPSNELSPTLVNLLHEIKIRGFQPIVAHPERNQAILQQPARVNDLLQQGALLQVNAGSLSGRSHSNTQKIAEEFVKQGIVTFISSDGHSMGHRSIMFNAAMENLKKTITKNELEALFCTNGKKVLDGEPIQVGVRHFEAKKGSILSRLKKLF